MPPAPTAVYAQYVPPASTGAAQQFGSNPGVLAPPPPLFERAPHPWTRANPLPDPETLSPQTRLLFQIADLQAENLIAPGGQHIRRSEFHNSVDAYGNTYNAYSNSLHISLPLALTSVLIALLASSAGLSLLFGGRRQHLVDAAPVTQRQSVALRDELTPDSDAVHLIEWEDPAVSPSPQATWESLVQTCSGDVMAAAAAIKAQVDADPELNPSSQEAFRRAIEALQPKPIAETT